MHRRLLAALAALAAVALLAVPVASADKPGKEPVPAPDVTGRFCPDFDVLVHALVNKEYAHTFSSGAAIVTGTLIVSLTNLSTNKTIEANVSGPGFFSADGSTFILGGRSLLYGIAGGLGPGSPPTLELTSGRTVVSFDPDGNVTGVTETGASTDLCPALAGP
jgi:hypothetical protein